MGRRETPLDPGAGPVQRFAFELRKLRQEAGGITYRAMAGRAGYSVTTLSQAAAGERLASLEVTLAYVRACGGDEREWAERWQQAAAEEEQRFAVNGTDTDAPYVGLRAYGTADGDRFFGRDRLIGDLLGVVRDRRFAVVVGSSGSGKSSLLRAGLVPAVRAGGLGEPLDAVRVLTPGEHPLRAHADRLAADDRALVLVDQFEEVFTLCPDPAERAAFIDLLLVAREPGAGLRVVLALRADFYGHCAAHRRLAGALRDASLLVGPMDRDELRAAIVKPAAARGLTVERALTARVIDDAGTEPGGLPLMSHALLETWKRRRGKMLTLEGYLQAGGINGAIAATAEQVYTSLSPAQAAQAKRVLLRLVSPGDRTADTRRPARRGELDPTGAPDTGLVIDLLARARLLTLDAGTVEIAHEALLSAWPRLATWIEQERDRLRIQRQLTQAAHAWSDLDRDPGALYRGTRLAAAAPLLATREDLTPLEYDFLDASRRSATRRRRLVRAVAIALAVLTAVAAGGTVTATRAEQQARAEQHNAEQRRKRELSRLVTMRAERQASTDPALAGLLSVAAWRLNRTAEARRGMLNHAARFPRMALTGHDSEIDMVAFSADGARLVSADADVVRVWRAADGRLLTTMPVKDSRRELSGDGTTMATWEYDITNPYDVVVRLWDTTTGHLRPMPGGPGVTELAFHPTQPVVATTDGRGIRLWNTVTGRPAGKPIDFGRRLHIDQLVFTRRGDTLAAVADDKVRLWDTRTGGARGRPFGQAVGEATFAPDGATVVTEDTNAFRLWRAADGRRIGDAIPNTGFGRDRYRLQVTFSPDGTILATAGATVNLWNTATGQRIGAPIKNTDPWVAFSPDGKTLATSGAGPFGSSDDLPSFVPTERPVHHQIQLWDTSTLRPLGAPLTGHAGRVGAMAFSPDGKTLVTGGHDTAIRLWDLTTRHPIADLPTPAQTFGRANSSGDTGHFGSIEFSSDGRTLAAATGRRIRLWDPVTRRFLGELTGHTGPVRTIVFSPDGRAIAGAGDDATVRLWDVATLRPIGLPLRQGFGQSLADIKDIAFSADGKSVVAADNFGVILRWDTVTGRPVGYLHELVSPDIYMVAFSPDGRTVVAVDGSGVMQMWDMVTRRPIGAPLNESEFGVGRLAFSPDGTIVAGARADGAVQLWDVASGLTTGAPLIAHRGALWGLAFTPDGKTLLTAGRDGQLRLWDVESGRPIGAPMASGTAVPGTALTFAPDGKTVAIGTAGGSVRLWDMSLPSDPAAAVCTIAGRSLTRTEWAEYLPGEPYREVC
ncbi:hypothetical protein [Spongiactinospora sp. 9N601]|uniref:nSTAND1 domain-containing NTPase n=1 Tax=Spongiactinospora sp. 9N601 TaxID=3375149 RepID=UPI003796EBF3